MNFLVEEHCATDIDDAKLRKGRSGACPLACLPSLKHLFFFILVSKAISVKVLLLAEMSPPSETLDPIHSLPVHTCDAAAISTAAGYEGREPFSKPNPDSISLRIIMTGLQLHVWECDSQKQS